MFALPIVLAAVLSGCAGSPADEPTESTPAAKSSAQVASAVAKTRPQLEEAMALFDSSECVVVMVMPEDYESRIMDCVGALDDMGALSRVMQHDLEYSRPWSEETRVLAEETVLQLGNMSEASNYADGKSMTVTTSAMASLRSQLQAWGPFGA